MSLMRLAAVGLGNRQVTMAHTFVEKRYKHLEGIMIKVPTVCLAKVILHIL